MNSSVQHRPAKQIKKGVVCGAFFFLSLVPATVPPHIPVMSKTPDYSILDLVPISEGSSAVTALTQTTDLARLGDDLGYKRLWYAEHHGMAAIASSSPEVLIAHAAAKTRRIRIGSGGVMLPNHVPLRVVETYRTLAGLYDNRIDLGMGRAGGTDQRTLKALNSFGGEHFAEQVAEMMAFERGRFPEGHPYAQVSVVPDEIPLPPIWILGSSGASAQFAGQYGFGYAFAAHFSKTPAGPAFADYRDTFVPSTAFPKPHTIICLAVVVAPTQEEAEWRAGSIKLMWRNLHAGEPDRIPSPETAAAYQYTPHEELALASQMQLVITGTPDTVAERIRAAAAAANADEVMISANMHGHAQRLDAFRGLATALDIPATPA